MSETNLSGLNVRDLLDAGLHFGHQTKRWNPKMKRYIFDKRNGVHIIDITQSLEMLEEGLKHVQKVVRDGKKILFVGTKKQAQEVIKHCADSCGMHYVTTRWLGGMLTNASTIRRSVRRMRQIEVISKNTNGAFSVHKKEAASLRRELEKLQRNLSGVADMTELPSLMFVIDIMREANAVAEARRLGIPVMAIVDTCCDPDHVDYIVPGNDDSIRSIKLISEAVAKVAKQAHEEYERIAADEHRKQEAERAARRASEQASREAAGARPGRDRASRVAAEAAKAKLSEGRRSAAARAASAVAARAAAAKAAESAADGSATEAIEATQAPAATEATQAPAPIEAAAETAAATESAAAAPVEAETPVATEEPVVAAEASAVTEETPQAED